VAGCASTDATRYVINGVLFSPDNGGTLIATNGRQLAGAPARVTGREFILPVGWRGHQPACISNSKIGWHGLRYGLARGFILKSFPHRSFPDI
jgi:hypothetical protein